MQGLTWSYMLHVHFVSQLAKVEYHICAFPKAELLLAMIGGKMTPVVSACYIPASPAQLTWPAWHNLAKSLILL